MESGPNVGAGPDRRYGRERRPTGGLARQDVTRRGHASSDVAGGVVRAKAFRTTIPATDGIRAGDLLNRDFTAPRPDHTCVTDFTYVRTWAGWVYVAFILDVFSQRIFAWHAQTTKHVDLVMIPLPMALWQRGR